MLLQFSFQNYCSFRDEAILDFQATSISEFDENLIRVGGDQKAALPVAVIYGPNAGGKSTVISALASLITTVVTPIMVSRGIKLSNVVLPRRKPFLFDATSPQNPIRFEVYFRKDNFDYRYGLSMLNDNVYEEYLFSRKVGNKKPTMLFTRNDKNVILGAELKKSSANISVNDQMPYLSFLEINYNFSTIQNVVSDRKSVV